MNMKITHLVLLAGVLASPLSAQQSVYSGDPEWSFDRTSERASSSSSGGSVGDIQMPSYNPNELRPSGDGLGRHMATQDVEMSGYNITGVANLIGDGMTRIVGLTAPTRDDEAANKYYVDSEIEKIENSLIDLSVSIGGLLGGGGGGIGIDLGLGLGGLLGGSSSEDTELSLNVIPTSEGARLAGLSDPVLADDAATKNYVDELMTSLVPATCGPGVTPGTACEGGAIYVGTLGFENRPTFTTATDSTMTMAYPEAEAYCAQLSEHGFDDFVLPDAQEFAVLSRHRDRGAFIGSYSQPTSTYWIASDDLTPEAARISDGVPQVGVGENYVRCVRASW